MGSTSLTTDSSGNLVENTFYTPYGLILSGGSSRFDYEGKEYDSLTGSYDFHFRMYNPSIGIYGVPDSLLPNVYDPQLLNRYSFERNNPWKNVDPSGHIAPVIVAGAIIFAVGFTVGFVSEAMIQHHKGEWNVGGLFIEGVRGGGISLGAAVVISTITVASPTLGILAPLVYEGYNLKKLADASSTIYEVEIDTKIPKPIEDKEEEQTSLEDVDKPFKGDEQQIYGKQENLGETGLNAGISMSLVSSGWTYVEDGDYYCVGSGCP